MKVYKSTITLQSNGERVSFHRITEEVNAAVAASRVIDGICTIYSHHTTCSVMLQERSFDTDEAGLEFMEKDLIDIFEQIIPVYQGNVKYHHPGQEAIAFAAQNGENESEARNTDAHLRSALLGRSESIPVENKKLDLGSFGHVFFIDFDITHARQRQVKVMIMGNTADEG